MLGDFPEIRNKLSILLFIQEKVEINYLSFYLSLSGKIGII